LWSSSCPRPYRYTQSGRNSRCKTHSSRTTIGKKCRRAVSVAACERTPSLEDAKFGQQRSKGERWVKTSARGATYRSRPQVSFLSVQETCGRTSEPSQETRPQRPSTVTDGGLRWPSTVTNGV